MANQPRITAGVANAMLNAAYEPGCDGGNLLIYSGTQPAAGGGALSGNTLLATFPMGSPAFGAASGGILTANSIGTSVAAATGTATWFRLMDSTSTTTYLDGSVGTSGADLNLASTSITSGSVLAITSFTITEPLL